MSAGGMRPRMSDPVSDLRTAMDVSGMNVIVTGGCSGIGRGIAQAFAQRGANVAILDIDTENGKAAVEDLRKLGRAPGLCSGREYDGLCDGAHRRASDGASSGESGGESGGDHLFVECDIADGRMVRKAVEAVNAVFNRVDVLVNNAGIATVQPFLDMDADLTEWHRVIGVDLHGTAYMTHAVANRMRSDGRGGLVINISSVGGMTCSASKELPNTPYVAAKAAINHLTKSWAVEFAEYGIRVNCIMPGPTHSKLDEQLTPEYEARIADGILDGRYGEPLEIGALCVFMAAREGAHLNGVVMAHDGGFLCIN